MGQIISVIQGNGKEAPNVAFNFDNVQPSEGEKEVYEDVNKVLCKAKQHINDLQHYKGCGELIRKALTTPGKETEAAAWEAVLPCVDAQKVFYDYAQELDKVVAKLLKPLSGGGVQGLDTQQALAFELASLMDFLLVFDECKMGCPHLQNDFSYYRRTINRLKLAKDDPSVRMKDEVANKVSLFFAYPSPMMKTVVEATSKLLDQDKTMSREVLCDVLATFANICVGMVERRLVQNEDSIYFVLRAMVGTIILYDHISPLGAFQKKSPILLKKAIVLLKRQPKQQTGLINALKYTTIHLTDATTPTSIAELLNES